MNNQAPHFDKPRDITKASDLPLNAYFIVDIDTENMFLHEKGFDNKTNEGIYELKPTEIGAIIFNKMQANYFIDKAELTNKLKPILCKDVFNKLKSNGSKTIN